MYAILMCWWRRGSSQRASQPVSHSVHFPSVCRVLRMEGLAAFVSKFDENSSKENNELKKMPSNSYSINQEKKDSRSSANQTNALPFSIEGILGINDQGAAKTSARPDNRIHSPEFNQGKTTVSHFIFSAIGFWKMASIELTSYSVIPSSYPLVGPTVQNLVYFNDCDHYDSVNLNLLAYERSIYLMKIKLFVQH